MLKNLRIRNYRVFKDLEISGLKRINLIAGGNNSGKTSLLEAILLLSGGADPTIALDENVIRGSVSDSLKTPRAVESMWRSFFKDLNTDCPIEISCDTDISNSMKLTMSVERWQGPAPTLLPIAAPTLAPASEIFDGKALTFRFCDTRGEASLGQMRFVNDSVEPHYSGNGGPFSARLAAPSQDEPSALGKLRTRKMDSVLLDALKVIEPGLLSVEDNFAAGTPMIWGDIGLSELVPLSIMGDAITRLSRIVLGISSASGGILLVDEIENGIHHSVMPDVWKAIGKAAKKFDTQIFATTHSFECVAGAVNGLGADGFQLSRLRINHMRHGVKGDGSNEVVSYDPETAEFAIRRRIEVR